jgi:hypothetical protein
MCWNVEVEEEVYFRFLGGLTPWNLRQFFAAVFTIARQMIAGQTPLGLGQARFE